MYRRLTTLVGALALLGAVAFFANYLFVHRHVATVLDSDPRNKGISVLAHYEYFVLPGSLFFDLRGVDQTNSPADVFRVFLQFAASRKDRDYDTVKLAFRGKPKFVLKGEDFKTLGVEYGTQNPVYTIRTFPEHLYRPDGTPAFGKWTGGLLGVLGKQMEDFTEFHKQWYISDLSRAGG